MCRCLLCDSFGLPLLRHARWRLRGRGRFATAEGVPRSDLVAHRVVSMSALASSGIVSPTTEADRRQCCPGAYC